MRSCIILCGGRSRRMGQDKGLMILEDKPLIIHLLETLEELVDEIIIVFRDQNQINSYQKLINDYQIHLKNHDPQIQLVTDLEKDQGPLVGILTGLSHVKAEGSLVLPCDSPFISGYFIDKIFKLVKKDKKSESLAIVPTWPDESVEPLHAYYFKECLPAIENILDMGLRDVKSLFKLINVNYIGVEVLDPEKKSFHNLNRPEDL
jgi:molybdenum cofactor guanylyltransferase